MFSGGHWFQQAVNAVLEADTGGRAQGKLPQVVGVQNQQGFQGEV